MNIGEKIKELRLKNGYTLEELGDKVGVGKSTVRKWENGMISNMRRDKIAKLALALNVTPDFFINYETHDDDFRNYAEITNLIYRNELLLEIIRDYKNKEKEINMDILRTYMGLNEDDRKVVDGMIMALSNKEK